ncbi:hypothetical protein [Paludisphaera mucosa]|uniref:Uncharacterized protein n=1 Tax=Paludisphaera mucosa TaxID=3030827 RepID=A0ABT6F6X5_9BACT|nr:hypothetical protein [Paludisphaera mucosa]MDG3003236.1 hypothetical protein [Paludisphaera mucosa]
MSVTLAQLIADSDDALAAKVAAKAAYDAARAAASAADALVMTALLAEPSTRAAYHDADDVLHVAARWPGPDGRPFAILAVDDADPA